MCSHIKGREYNGELCCGELSDPTDAYEFSFVAVPAQRAAGVIKTSIKEKNMETIKSLLACEKELCLSPREAESLRAYVGELEKKAQYADAYRAELCDTLRQKVASLQIEVDYDTSKSIIEKLDVAELQSLIRALEHKPAQQAVPQLCRQTVQQHPGNTEFRI